MYSQEVVYKQYTPENGLVSSYTTQVFQDDQGYIWISTNNGVVKFDGYSFENFDVNNGLLENDIVKIIKEENNVIWFLSRSGLLSYYKDEKIHHYPFNDKILRVLNEYDFVEPSSVRIKNQTVEFNVYENARYRIDSTGSISKVYKLLDRINVIDVREGKERYFLSSQNQDLKLIYDNETSIVPSPNICGDEPVLLEEKNQTLYIASQNFLYVIKDRETYTCSYNDNISSLNIDRRGDLWLGFESGGLYYYKNADVASGKTNEELRGVSVSSVIKDKQNSLWVTSTNNGLIYIPSQNFKQITTKEGLLDNNITRLTFSDNYLWAITGNNAIARLDFTNLRNYKFSNPDFSRITDLHWYNDRLWVSFKNKISYFKGEELVEVLRLDNSYGRYSRINRINHGIGNDLWLSKSNGFAQLRNSKMVFESSVQNLQNLNVNGIVTEPNGHLWLACKNGLWRFENNKLYNYNRDNELLTTNIIDIAKDEKLGAIWLAINGVGVVKILNDSVWLMSEKEGLVSNSVTSIYPQGNYLWVGTREGVSRINVKSKGFKSEITNITINDGLISNEINDIVVNKTYVCVATNKGLGYFDHKRFKPNSNNADVKIDAIRVNGEHVDKEAKSITIGYYSNNISIDYKVIHFRRRGKVDYRYRIEGLDKDWTYTQNTNATYPFLPPGSYTFLVEVPDKKNSWLNQATQIEIIVKKPFWLEWWFLLILGIAAFGEGFFLYKTFIIARRKKERLRQEVNEYRQMALTKQMNPHFIFNSLNSIQHYILQNDKRLSNRFLTKFARLIRLILENSQSSLITLDKELVALNLYLELEALRFKEKLQYKIEIKPEIDILGIEIPPMLIQPFVENAIWHGIMNKEDGGQGILSICFDSDSEKVICVINDNGVGRAKASEINEKKNKNHTSMGTIITQDRIELINNIYKKEFTVEYTDLTDNTGNPTGTSVKIVFMK